MSSPRDLSFDATTLEARGYQFNRARSRPQSLAAIQAPAPDPTDRLTSLLDVADLPPQDEVDRALSSYESYAWILDRVDDHADALATLREALGKNF